MIPVTIQFNNETKVAECEIYNSKIFLKLPEDYDGYTDRGREVVDRLATFLSVTMPLGSKSGDE